MIKLKKNLKKKSKLTILQKERKQKLIPRLRKQKKSKRSLNRIKWNKAIKEMVLKERA
jgi:hypothetical protein